MKFCDQVTPNVPEIRVIGRFLRHVPIQMHNVGFMPQLLLHPLQTQLPIDGFTITGAHQNRQTVNHRCSQVAQKNMPLMQGHKFSKQKACFQQHLVGNEMPQQVAFATTSAAGTATRSAALHMGPRSFSAMITRLSCSETDPI